MMDSLAHDGSKSESFWKKCGTMLFKSQFHQTEALNYGHSLRIHMISPNYH